MYQKKVIIPNQKNIKFIHTLQKAECYGDTKLYFSLTISKTKNNKYIIFLHLLDNSFGNIYNILPEIYLYLREQYSDLNHNNIYLAELHKAVGHSYRVLFKEDDSFVINNHNLTSAIVYGDISKEELFFLYSYIPVEDDYRMSFLNRLVTPEGMISFFKQNIFEEELIYDFLLEEINNLKEDKLLRDFIFNFIEEKKPILLDNDVFKHFFNNKFIYYFELNENFFENKPYLFEIIEVLLNKNNLEKYNIQGILLKNKIKKF